MKFQRALGREIFEYDENNIHAWVVKHPLWFGRSYLYIPHGPEMDLNAMTGGFKNPTAAFARWLCNLAHQHKAIFVKVEPLADNIAQLLVTEGKFRRSKKIIQPAKTVVLDLERGEDELLSAMHHKTRYNIKVAEKNNITVEDGKDYEIFWQLMKKTAKRDRFSPHGKEYYRRLLELNGEIKTDLVVAWKNQTPVAAAIIATYNDTGYYLHGASDYEYRNLMAPYKLHWENIKYLKARGIKKYDLWGIDARKWPGVTRFKLGWGGQTIEYPGAFNLVFSRVWYWGYSLARKIF